MPEIPVLLDVEDVSSSKYLQIRRVSFKEQGVVKNWDVIKSHDSVGIVLYHKEKDGFIFVRQFRLPVFLKNNQGFMYELCAGLLDKGKTPLQTAIEEVEEECGYFIDSKNMHPFFNFYSGVGTGGACQYLFYAEVSEDIKKTEGGGSKEELENIDVIFVPRSRIFEFLEDESCAKTTSLAFGTIWYLTRIDKKGF
ncbi:hypothetical protein BKH40_05910 [Helicobacter sp. 11S02629-2]|nr:hypothetical protein BKH40_05910 [Helicobacter sp. 11S02629-2]